MKASIPIFGFISHPSPDIQAIFMNLNIVILALYLFQVLPKFQKNIRCLMTVPQKIRKKKIIPLTIPSMDDKDKLYARAKKSNQNQVQTNHTFV